MEPHVAGADSQNYCHLLPCGVIQSHILGVSVATTTPTPNTGVLEHCGDKNVAQFPCSLGCSLVVEEVVTDVQVQNNRITQMYNFHVFQK